MAHLRLQSARLLLVAASRPILEAELDDRTRLAREVGAEIPLGWPPALYDRQAILFTMDRLREDPDAVGWWNWYVLARRPGDRPLAIGVAGFKGRPDDAGAVEIGYGIVAAHRGRGYATETARALCAWAFDHPGVSMIRSETLDEGADSMRVLEKLGFVPEVEAPAPGIRGFRLVRGS